MTQLRRFKRILAGVLCLALGLTLPGCDGGSPAPAQVPEGESLAQTVPTLPTWTEPPIPGLESLPEPTEPPLTEAPQTQPPEMGQPTEPDEPAPTEPVAEEASVAEVNVVQEVKKEEISNEAADQLAE